MTRYDYNGFVIVVGANGLVLVHLNDKGEPGKLVSRLKSFGEAIRWIDYGATMNKKDAS